MGKGKSGSKHSYYPFKKRCQFPGCKKRAKYEIDGNYYCKKHNN